MTGIPPKEISPQTSAGYLYQVLITLAPTVDRKEWEAWMITDHIPKVLACKGFWDAKLVNLKGDEALHTFGRQLAPPLMTDTPCYDYSVSYHIENLDLLRQYMQGPGQALREEYRLQYGSQSTAERRCVKVVQTIFPVCAIIPSHHPENTK